MTQPLDLEMLKILHPLAQRARRTAQQAQRLGMPGQKIGMPAEIGQNIATADLPRNFGRSGALPLGFVARKINHGRLPRSGRERVTAGPAAEEHCNHSIISKPNACTILRPAPIEASRQRASMEEM